MNISKLGLRIFSILISNLDLISISILNSNQITNSQKYSQIFWDLEYFHEFVIRIEFRFKLNTYFNLNSI